MPMQKVIVKYFVQLTRFLKKKKSLITFDAANLRFNCISSVPHQHHIPTIQYAFTLYNTMQKKLHISHEHTMQLYIYRNCLRDLAPSKNCIMFMCILT